MPSLLLLTAILAPTLAFADDGVPARAADVFKQLSNLNILFSASERPSGNGQIEACIPTADPASSLAKLRERLNYARPLFQKAYSAHLAATQDAESLGITASSEFGDICGASPEVKSKVAQLKSAVQSSTKDLGASCDELKAVRTAFQKQYGQRAPSPLKPNCAQTWNNVKLAFKFLSQATVDCDPIVKEAGVTQDEVRNLSSSLDAGCNASCRAIQYAVSTKHPFKAHTFLIEARDATGTITTFADNVLEHQVENKLSECRQAMGAAEK